jgi:phosphatidylserine/phosphatidylglycerophosphate/cardiolipin synthase-like enzyme
MRIRTRKSVETPKPTSPTSATPATGDAKPTARPYAPPPGKVVVKSTGMDPPVKATKPTDLTGAGPAVPPPPIAGPDSAAGAKATVAVAFDNIKAPGGPARARLLSDGLDSWNARMELIESAKTTLDASYFILEKDPYGFAFLGGLLKKQLEGVQVRLSTDAMADTFGKHGFKMPLMGKDYLQELVNHGAEAYIYHPISSRLSDVVRGDYGLLASNHDKILVADGQRGITGGRNIAQDYFASPKDLKGAWRDMDVLVEGREVARGLVEAFDAELGNGDASHPVRKDLFGNWDKKDIQLLGAYEMMNIWVSAPPLSEAEKEAVRADPAKREALAGALVEQALAKVEDVLPPKLKRPPSNADRTFLKEQALALVGHQETRGSRARYEAGAAATRQTEVKIIDQTSAASGQRINNMAGALTALVDSAKNRIVIQNPYVGGAHPRHARRAQAGRRARREDRDHHQQPAFHRQRRHPGLLSRGLAADPRRVPQRENLRGHRKSQIPREERRHRRRPGRRQHLQPRPLVRLRERRGGRGGEVQRACRGPARRLCRRHEDAGQRLPRIHHRAGRRR